MNKPLRACLDVGSVFAPTEVRPNGSPICRHCAYAIRDEGPEGPEGGPEVWVGVVSGTPLCHAETTRLKAHAPVRCALCITSHGAAWDAPAPLGIWWTGAIYVCESHKPEDTT